MPERNHEVIIDDYVFPDTVTVTLSNDDFIDSRDYVSKELYESVCAANDAWQTENAKLRELVCHLYYVKPRDVTSILVNGEVLDFDELMAEVGLRWEDA